MGIKIWKVVFEFYSIIRHAICLGAPVFNFQKATSTLSGIATPVKDPVLFLPPGQKSIGSFLEHVKIGGVSGGTGGSGRDDLRSLESQKSSRVSTNDKETKDGKHQHSSQSITDMLPRCVEKIPTVRYGDKIVKIEDCMARLFSIYSPTEAPSTVSVDVPQRASPWAFVRKGGPLSSPSENLDPETAMLRELDRQDASSSPPPPPSPSPTKARDFAFTAYYNSFIKPVIEEYDRFGDKLRVYVIVCDKSEFPVRGKDRERKDREKNARPYPKGSKIVEEKGLVLSTGEVVNMNIARTMQSGRELRMQLYHIFLKCMKKDHRVRKIPIIFDFEAVGPYALFDGKCEQLPEFKNTYGEADIAAYHWAVAYAQYNHVVVRCIDRDLFFIGLLNQHRCPISLHFQECNTESFNLKHIAGEMHDANFSIESVVIAAILGHCDFVEKKKVRDRDRIPSNLLLALIVCLHCVEKGLSSTGRCWTCQRSRWRVTP